MDDEELDLNISQDRTRLEYLVVWSDCMADLMCLV